MLATTVIEFFLIALFVGLLGLAAMSDVHAYRIPNRISLAIAALYPAFVLVHGDPVNWLGALAVAAAVLVFGFILFATNTVGGGDVKLLTAVALWAGPSLVLEFLLITAFAGGLLALVMTSELRFSLAMAVERIGGKGLRDVLIGNVLPYGVAIAAGGFFVAWNLLRGFQG
ncbi:MAG: prepilin peptidase [Hyphomicrobiales bacterium]|nr:prepilin peptidase [Hyphomicrobiales bacterium]MCP5371605.1 prepilin peptidase [Hyphomicrobiales bacterium]